MQPMAFLLQQLSSRSDPSTGLQLTRARFVYLSCRSLFLISDTRRVLGTVVYLL